MTPVNLHRLAWLHVQGAWCVLRYDHNPLAALRQIKMAAQTTVLATTYQIKNFNQQIKARLSLRNLERTMPGHFDREHSLRMDRELDRMDGGKP